MTRGSNASRRAVWAAISSSRSANGPLTVTGLRPEAKIAVYEHHVGSDRWVLAGGHVNERANKVTVTGFDRQQVGQVAAEIRGLRPPEPYKGKGIRYKDEYIFRKEGKKK